jgi:hypothetical protein
MLKPLQCPILYDDGHTANTLITENRKWELVRPWPQTQVLPDGWRCRNGQAALL